jgi:putative flippase GtrA
VSQPRPASSVVTGLSQHRERGLRYLVIGGFNTLFGIASFVLLQQTLGAHIGYLAVLVISWVLNILEAFLAYRFLVFRVQGHFFLDLARFSSVYLASFGFNLVALPLAVELLGLPVIAAQACVLLVVVVASYTAHSSFSFRRSPSGGDEDLPPDDDGPERRPLGSADHRA